MTLCIVWRDESKIKFASDSRLSFGSAGTSDFGIKVVRIPFKIYGPGEIAGAEPISSGDLGMAFAGSAIGALMVKEALAEVLFRMQGVPNFHDCGMDGIADFVFRAYKVISKDLCTTMLENGRTCIVFGGCCAIQKKLRAFRIETDTQNQQRKSEVLTDTDMEIFGEGKAAAAARKLMPPEAKEPQIVEVLQSVIDDPNVPSVGGNIQYGSFFGSRFQPHGVAKITDGEAHYWRASLDLNGPDFDQVKGLVPVFPLLNLTGV
jgi:hypothetical protein